ncbi:MAG: Fe-S cluster assembly ATPase SufC [Spirochaetes bacterium]|nr:Fe-S cluster assembly ATPase SufC [Spirochaetota bacterium]
MLLQIEDLHARIETKEILRGVNLRIQLGEIHALMGPNGSGKSTLANVLMGHPSYTVTSGRILFDGKDILETDPEDRAALGMFLAFQYPVEVPGVTVGKFLKRSTEILRAEKGSFNVTRFIEEVRSLMDTMGMDRSFINRYLNEGFSGGEKKRMEILQMLLFRPKLAILDETDSGLDIDALRIVAQGVNRLRGDRFSSLIITHYQRILEYLKPDKVHIMMDGRIVLSGGAELVGELETRGYDWIREEVQV